MQVGVGGNAFDFAEECCKKVICRVRTQRVAICSSMAALLIRGGAFERVERQPVPERFVLFDKNSNCSAKRDVTQPIFNPKDHVSQARFSRNQSSMQEAADEVNLCPISV